MNITKIKSTKNQIEFKQYSTHVYLNIIQITPTPEQEN